MNLAERSQFLEGSPWFVEAPAEVLDGLVEASALKTFPANSFLWRLGEANTEVFGVVSGRVRVSVAGSMGQEFAIVDRAAGAWLGEPCLDNDLGRATEVKTLSPADILVIPRHAVLAAAQAWPLLYRNLFSNSMTHQRGLYEVLAGVLFLPLRARVAGRLLVLIGEYGREVADGTLIDMRVSQKDFARLTMGSRQRVNRIFRDWEKQGLLQSLGDKLLIKDVAGLEREIRPYWKTNQLGGW